MGVSSLFLDHVVTEFLKAMMSYWSADGSPTSSGRRTLGTGLHRSEADFKITLQNPWGFRLIENTKEVPSNVKPELELMHWTWKQKGSVTASVGSSGCCWEVYRTCLRSAHAFSCQRSGFQCFLHLTVAASAMQHYAVLDVIYLSSVVIKMAVKIIFSFVHGWIMFPVFATSVHIKHFFQDLGQTANQKSAVEVVNYQYRLYQL